MSVARVLLLNSVVTLLAACSDVQSVRLGEVPQLRAGTGSAPLDAGRAGAPAPAAGGNAAPNTRPDAGVSVMLDGAATSVPDPSPPKAADAGARRIEDASVDADDDDDEDDDDDDDWNWFDDEDGGR